MTKRMLVYLSDGRRLSVPVPRSRDDIEVIAQVAASEVANAEYNHAREVLTREWQRSDPWQRLKGWLERVGVECCDP